MRRIRELGMVCQCNVSCFCTLYSSEMNTHSYMPILFRIKFLFHNPQQGRESILPTASLIQSQALTRALGLISGTQ